MNQELRMISRIGNLLKPLSMDAKARVMRYVSDQMNEEYQAIENAKYAKSASGALRYSGETTGSEECANQKVRDNYQKN